MNRTILMGTILSWIMPFIFISLGILNFIFVHPVPGLFYLVVSLIYIPPVGIYIKNRFGFSIPPFVKFVLAFAILWATLGVSDLAEMAGL